MRAGVFLVLILSGLSISANAGEIFKWVDSEGKVHYSDQPVAGKVEPGKLNVSNSPVSGVEEGVSASQKLSEKDAAFRKRREEEAAAKAKREKADADAYAKQQNCERARGNLRLLQAGGRLSSVNAQGEHEPMDDTAREQAEADAQKSVDSWCK